MNTDSGVIVLYASIISLILRSLLDFTKHDGNKSDVLINKIHSVTILLYLHC